MINLMSPTEKADIRAARINVVLGHYIVMLLLLGVLIGAIYGLGFWLVRGDMAAVAEKRESLSAQTKAYEAQEKEAQTFRKNLLIAKNILDKDTAYSTFLTGLAADMPNGAVLTGLSLGQKVVTPIDPLTLDAQVNSYETVLVLKSKLEASSRFKNVSIANVSRGEDISKLTGNEAKYPFKASYSVVMETTK
ncbi:MAG TPA: hypothetical protein VF597_03780 [Candidatus Saccharimonadales bacterium]|jgi:Tfp pilus assembly protein PilN